ncbi:MAG: hypothetical protein HOZ81_53645 [Streptomyces sp.]|nr:hypothetical protein [Streptomyces sp.]NUS30512.1 hypothetical protein [Streptomyces sp.]
MSALDTVLTCLLTFWFTLLSAGKLLGTAQTAERAAHLGFTVGGWRVMAGSNWPGFSACSSDGRSPAWGSPPRPVSSACSPT